MEIIQKPATTQPPHWNKVLLTDAGWYTSFHLFNESTLKKKILRTFHEMLEMPPEKAKVLFITTAACGNDYYPAAGICFAELLSAGILPNNITPHDIDGTLSAEEAMQYDVIYITGGNTTHLLNKINNFKFDLIIKKMIFANKLYVGASAGSLIATPHIGEPFDEKTAGLSLINVYLSFHNPPNTPPRTDLPLPHIPLTENQAIMVRHDGYTLIESEDL